MPYTLCKIINNNNLRSKEILFEVSKIFGKHLPSHWKYERRRREKKYDNVQKETFTLETRTNQRELSIRNRRRATPTFRTVLYDRGPRERKAPLSRDNRSDGCVVNLFVVGFVFVAAVTVFFPPSSDLDRDDRLACTDSLYSRLLSRRASLTFSQALVNIRGNRGINRRSTT